jgi:AcrR family transcriptional regulator
MGRRRQQLEATRERITEAAFELHSTIGPAQTTISAVADLAGVQRHTVYHHFPDMTSLIRACTEHALQVTGVPEAAPWRTIDDPTVRLRRALDELYRFYRANARVLANITRDLTMMTEVGGVEPFLERMTELFTALAPGWPGDAPTQRVRMAALGHAMAYPTWKSLTDYGLSDTEARDLMLRLVDAVEGHTTPVHDRPDSN